MGKGWDLTLCQAFLLLHFFLLFLPSPSVSDRDLGKDHVPHVTMCSLFMSKGKKKVQKFCYFPQVPQLVLENPDFRVPDFILLKPCPPLHTRPFTMENPVFSMLRYWS